MSLLLLFSLGGGGVAPVVTLPTNTPGRLLQQPPDWRDQLQETRAQLGLVERPIIARPELPAFTPDLSAQLAKVQAKLAANSEKQAQLAEKQAGAKAELALQRYQARQERLALEQTELERLLVQQIEETDVAFVAALLMEA